MADTLGQILIERANAGVRILVLYDAFGTLDIPARNRDALRAAGIVVEPFRPIRLSTLHLPQNRSHVRGIVIDSRVGWTGGFGTSAWALERAMNSPRTPHQLRYLDQLGRLARQDVKVVMHNTLAASDYSLLDERTGFTPKPNYWGALLWRRLMGTTVLESGVPIQAGLHVYAHCLRDRPEGVALLAINTDRMTARTLTIPAGERYTLSAAGSNLQERRVQLNGVDLTLGANDELPMFKPEATAEGMISLAPATITFIAIPAAANAACR